MWSPDQDRSKRGFGVLLSAMPGLITLTVESISTYLKSHQVKCISYAVNPMRQDDYIARNNLQQYSNDFLMYGITQHGNFRQSNRYSKLTL